ncbi:peptidase G2 [Bacillus velezensis]|uniref:peptidase G2 autoproteolytic cleavage domain-containing protein n=1 Tax=Bacillus amyloliquefaciens group TaxID=1938374 RepID=UPI0006A80785|nr:MULTISPECIES: peptidase G2 autoproteolytic cleavage domain-containing protein [Bacillus amyloliquefaciens group]MCA1231448.1 peptidase G2 [Bacillus velezensis]MCA1309548.1 peptidase G2 [Bacillus velezensis]MCA1329159.1 peptidase G2 [Bacillus velezensis]MCM3276645.1 peptidase G2 [Bacillus velezensis]MCM3349807.1 peptidase G2 [Bacillus velezensis]
MVSLNKNHTIDPASRFVSTLNENARLAESAINENNDKLLAHKNAEVAHTSAQVDHGGFSVSNRLTNLFARITNLIVNHDGSDVKEVVDARVTTDGEIAATVKDRLDLEFNRLNKKIKRVVNVDDFGADPTGATDSTEAFKKAFGKGKVEVNMSAGMYVVRGLKIPSWVRLVGQGIGVTFLVLNDETPASEWVITNADYEKGNRNIHLEGFSTDWNQTRQGGLKATGGQHSSCVAFANTKFLWIKNIETINPALHGIDITAPTYDHLPDTDYTKDGCKYVWIDSCVSTGYGDDGITTHYSEYIFISNCHCTNPTGIAHAAGQANSNGIEVDDGSKNVWLLNNYTEGNIRGVEVKAHKEWPASQNVHIIGHVSFRDVRSYDLRHIGHHKAEDQESTTAFNVTLTDCTAIEPVYNDLYTGVTPRALVVSAYKNVQIVNFTAIGDPNYDYKDQPAVAFQYRCRYITVNGIKMKGFKKASNDIRVIGGAQKADFVKISNFDIFDSAPVGIELGGGVYHSNVMNGTMIGNNGSIGILSPNNQTTIVGVEATGYKLPAKLAGREYSTIPTRVKGGFMGGNTSGSALHEASAILGGTGDNIAKGPANVLLGVRGGSTTEGSRQALIAVNNCHTKGDGNSRAILASQGVINDNRYSVRGGYGTGSASTKNTRWELDSSGGHIRGTGRVESVSDFKDFAEYFESADGKKIDSSYLVALEGEKIRKAEKGDKILGVVSETAGLVLGGAAFYWNDQYVRNEFGGTVYETVFHGGEEIRIPKLNPDYDPSLEYVPRDSRDEWHVIGLIGQVFVRIDETVSVGDSVSAIGGIATKAESGGYGTVMRIKSPYDAEKGYGVAQMIVTPQH